MLEPNYHTAKFFKQNLLVIESRKTQILMNKTDHLDLSILDLSKTVMREFWYDYAKRFYIMKTQNLSLLLILMDTESFTFYVKPKDI